MISLGLIGKDIGHSKSKEVYEGLLGEEINYHHFDIASEEELPCLDSVFKKVQGVSITSPYKRSYIGQVRLDAGAQKVRAINSIRFSNDCGYEGTNTDYTALTEVFSKYQRLIPDLRVAVLGSGVMASVTRSVLTELAINFNEYARSRGDQIKTTDFGKTKEKPSIIVNCCSRDFVFAGEIPSGAIFYDYNYSFSPHRDYFHGKKCQYVDGIDLLKRQAIAALSFFKIQKF